MTNYPRLQEIVPAPVWADRVRAACSVGAITRLRGAHGLVDAMAGTDAQIYLAGVLSPSGLKTELERSPGWKRVRHGRCHVR